MTTMAVISPGAMGSAIARRLTDAGVRVLTSLDGRSPATIDRASAAGMADAPWDQLARADLFLSIVPPHSAEEVAQRFAATRVDRPALYVDCNALAPDTKQRLGAMIGGRFVDACIIGLPGDDGGPSLYASGDAAADGRILGELGLRYRPLDAEIGAAAALKMAYAGMNKGMLILGAMMMLGAERAGVSAALIEQLDESFPMMRRRLAGTPMLFEKAWRWIAEMREIAAFATPEDGADATFEGFARFCERISADDGADRSALIR